MTAALVIGAGAVGLSTAYHLAQRRFGRVVVVDKGPVGDGASSRAAGIITGLLWTPTGVAVRRLSLRRFRELSAELPGYRYRDVGCLNLFRTDDLAARQALCPLYDRLGAPYELLDAAQVRRRWPALAPHDGLAAQFDPDGGYSEPDEYLPALAAGCRDLGVDIRQGTAVTGFLERRGRIAGVVTAAGELEADAVVCASHVWTGVLFQRLGRQVPLKFFVHQRYVTPALPRPPALPAVNAHPYGGYLRPAAGGAVLAGVEAPERREYAVRDLAFHMDGLAVPDEMRRRAQDVLALTPTLGAPGWASQKVGLLCFSADGEPLLGPVGGCPGLFVGTAFHSGGFAYGPAAGQLLAELVSVGTPSIDLSAFAPDRFADATTAHFNAATMTQAQYGDSISSFLPRKF